MATVDLYGNDAGQIRNAYRTNLRRDASDDEVSGWLSGSYGGGGLNDWLGQISNSHEAQQYKTPAPQPVVQPNPVNTTMPVQQSPYQNTDWWSQRGVSQSEMFDANGQMKPGWARTGQGYERTTPTVAGPQNGNYQQWFQTLTQGRAPNPQSLRDLAPTLQQYGIRLGPNNARGFTDGIILPDGRFIDVILSATENGGTGWGWIQPGEGGGGGGISGVNLPQSQYSDPHTKLLEELMLARINSLQGGNDPGLQRLMSFLEQRFNELQGPGYTGAENEVLRTQALDPIERDRAAARKRVTERMAAAGHTMESGVMQMALNEVDKAFDAERATSQNVLATTELNRREGRSQQAGQIAGSMYEIPQARAREALGYAGGLADLGPQRLQLAMQAAGMGGNPSSMFQNLMQLAQLNQNSALLDQRNSGQLWSGLGSLAYTLMNAGR